MSAFTSISWQLIQLLALNALMVFSVMAQPGSDYQWLDWPARFAPEEGIALWHQYPDEERLRLYFPAVQIKLPSELFEEDYFENMEQMIFRMQRGWELLLKSLLSHHFGVNDKSLYKFVEDLHVLIVPSVYKGGGNILSMCKEVDMKSKVILDLSEKAHFINFIISQLFLQKTRISVYLKIGDTIISIEEDFEFDEDRCILCSSKIEDSSEESKDHLYFILRNFIKHINDSNTNRDIIKYVSNLTKTILVLHPYKDGNGRITRMLTNYLFMLYGMPPPTLEFNSPVFLTDDQYQSQLIDGIHLSYQLISHNFDSKWK